MRTIFRQLKNEWRSNFMLGIELLVVFVILWYIVDWCCVTARVYFHLWDLIQTIAIA